MNNIVLSDGNNFFDFSNQMLKNLFIYNIHKLLFYPEKTPLHILLMKCFCFRG